MSESFFSTQTTTGRGKASKRWRFRERRCCDWRHCSLWKARRYIGRRS